MKTERQHTAHLTRSWFTTASAGVSAVASHRAWKIPALLAVGLLVGVGCGQSTAKPDDNAALVAPRASSADRVVAPAIVEPLGGAVELAAQEAGRVAEIFVKEGQKVTAGTRLARLDDGLQAAAVQASRSDVAEAEASLARARRGATQDELMQLRQERDAALARARISADDSSRNKRLAEKGAITEAELLRSENQAQADAASAAALEARYKNLAAGTRREDLAIAQARVEAAQARLAQTSASLERRQVVAPQDGTVLLSRYQPGEYYNPGGEALFVLGDVSRYQLRADVDEIDTARVQLGATAKVRTDQGSQVVAEGQVTWVAPQMGRKSLSTESPTARGDIRIREVLVETPAQSPLLPGLRVWVEIPASTVPASTAAAPAAP